MALGLQDLRAEQRDWLMSRKQTGGFASTSDVVRDMIRREQEKEWETLTNRFESMSGEGAPGPEPEEEVNLLVGQGRERARNSYKFVKNWSATTVTCWIWKSPSVSKSSGRKHSSPDCSALRTRQCPAQRVEKLGTPPMGQNPLWKAQSGQAVAKREFFRNIFRKVDLNGSSVKPK